jgi:membrane protein
MDLKATVPLLKRAYNEWSEDKASRLAAALAYFTAISLAPLLVLAVTLLGWLNYDGRSAVENQMGVLMGQTGKDAATMMIDAAKQQSGILATIVSLLVLIFGASGVFAELQDSMNTIWEVQPNPNLSWWDLIKARFFSLAMVFGVIFLLLVSLIITTIIGGLVKSVAGEGRIVGLVLDIVLSLIIYCVIFMLLFKYLPDVKIKFRDVWIGAAVTAVLFTIGKYILTLYLTMGSTASAYGAAGSLAALLIWVYYSAQILFFGAEFTQVYARKYGSRIKPAEHAVPITEERRAQQGLVRQHDLETSAQGASLLADQRGAVYGEGLARPRIVTITRPAMGAAKASAVAAAGLAAGFAVGLIGLTRGRRLIRGSLAQARLQQRLDHLDERIDRAARIAQYIDEDVKSHRRWWSWSTPAETGPWATLKQGARSAVESFRTHARSG